MWWGSEVFRLRRVVVPFANNGNLKIHYTEWGKPGAPVVILLHGLMLSSPLFEPLATRLTEWRVIAVDLRGHGGSSRPRQRERYSWESLASDVVAVMDALKISKAVIGGLSLGANVTLEFAHRYPKRVAALIIEMPVLTTSEGPARAVFGWLANTLRHARPLLDRPTACIRKRAPSSRSSTLAVLHHIFAMDALASAALIDGLDVCSLPLHDVKALGAITAPTLVIGHRYDPIHHHDDAAILAKRIRNAELVSTATIADFRVLPDRYAETVSRFLRRHVGTLSALPSSVASAHHMEGFIKRPALRRAQRKRAS